jgi:AraC family transcriptional regulator
MNHHSAFGGRVLAARRVNGFGLSETCYESMTRMPEHAHGSPYFCFVRRGAFRERAGCRAVEHSVGAIVFHRAEEEHADQFLEGGARCFNVELPTALVPGQADSRLADASRLPRLRGILVALYREFASADASALVLEGLAYQAIGEAFERRLSQPDRGPRWIGQVRDEIHARLDEDLTLGDLAAKVGMHPVHVARSFQARYGAKVTDYIREQRVSRARELLARTPTALADVAIAAGFADQSHFCRVFKQRTGLTPGQFRRASRVRPR